MAIVTVFTPTYNRANTLDRVFESLKMQTFNDFEWIVVDDGSTDNTKQLIEEYKKVSVFPITYIYQENGGKHKAINVAVNIAKGDFFLIADSDDSFISTTLEELLKAWSSIPDVEKERFKGVTVKSFDATTKMDNGDFSAEKLVSTDLDAIFKNRFNFEKWNFIKTSVMKEFPFPEPNEKLSFYPETVVWCRMARKYKTLYLNKALRCYYRDQENSLINNSNRSKETRYLWQFFLNEVKDYIKNNIKMYLKCIIGYSRDTFLSKHIFKESIKELNSKWDRFLCYFMFPLAYIFVLKKKRR